MSSSLIQVALTGINAAQVGLTTTGHNISNASTAGYNRQAVVQAASEPSFSGSGYVGGGVDVRSVQRSYSGFLVAQERAAQSQASRSAAYEDGVAQITNLVGDTNRSVGMAFSDFFSSMQQLTTDPSDTASRQAVIASAQTAAQRVRDIAGGLSDQRNDLNDRIGQALTDINSRTREIANLNSRIAGEVADGRAPNDLLDQRDQALLELNKIVRTSAVPQSDGAVNVYLSNGQGLVVGGSVQQLAMVANPLDAKSPLPGIKSAAGGMPFPTDIDLGGEVGGLLAVRDEALTAAEAQLNRIALAFTTTMNAQHRLGTDLAGRAGGDLFAVDQSYVTAGARNTGNATFAIDVSSAADLAASDYRVSFSDGKYTVTRNSDGVQKSFDGPTMEFDGLKVTVSGAAKPGDAFVLSGAGNAAATLRVTLTSPAAVAAGAAGSTAAGDNRNAQALAALADTNALEHMTFAGAYSQMVAELGVKGREATAAKAANQSLADAASQARDNVSGVNLDEEAANMLRYQQAYQAAGKVLSVANTLFEAILSATR